MRPLDSFVGSIVLAGGLLLTACTTSDGGDTQVDVTPIATPSPAATLTDTAVLGRSCAVPRTAQERGLPWLRLDHDGRFGGYDGCNSVGGTWTLDQDGRSVTVGIRASTAVACPGREVDLGRLTFDGTALTYRRGDGSAGRLAPAGKVVFPGSDMLATGLLVVHTDLAGDEAVRDVLTKVFQVQAMDDEAWLRALDIAWPQWGNPSSYEEGWDLLRSTPDAVRLRFMTEKRSRLRFKTRDGDTARTQR